MSTPAERVQAFVDARIRTGVRTGISVPLERRGYVTLEINDLKALLAANDRHNRLIGQVVQLMPELDAHEAQEGAPVECRGVKGSWFDVKDKLNEMTRNMG